MIIRHKNKKFDVKVCFTIFSHFLGLMFRFPKNDGLLFIFDREREIALHMLFVFITIDIVYLNKDKKVIKILKKVKPFALYIEPVKCKYILELKDAKNIKLEEILRFRQR